MLSISNPMKCVAEAVAYYLDERKENYYLNGIDKEGSGSARGPPVWAWATPCTGRSSAACSTGSPRTAVASGFKTPVARTARPAGT